MTAILDASVMLAYLLDEPGRDLAEEAIAARGSISTVNLAEVMSRLVRNGTDPTVSADVLLALPITVVPIWMRTWPSRRARCSIHTKPFGLSLGDRACLALAKREQLPALTADRFLAAGGAAGRRRSQADPVAWSALPVQLHRVVEEEVRGAAARAAASAAPGSGRRNPSAGSRWRTAAGPSRSSRSRPARARVFAIVAGPTAA